MGKTILFQGDSITDVGRREDSAGLGNGYVRMIAESLAARGGDDKVLNRGISGNRTKDLVARWQEDCVDLKPDILTVLIGINDCWRKYDSNDETPIDVFEANYDSILARTRKETDAAIILMEPFVLPVPADRLAWRVTVDPMIQAVRRLAKKHGTYLIALDGLFATWSLTREYADLAADGVHPTSLGHAMIRDAWLELYDSMK